MAAYEAAGVVLAAGDPGHHDVADDQRCAGDRKAHLVVSDLGAPQNLAVGGAQGLEMRVERRSVNHTVLQRQAAGLDAATDHRAHVGWQIDRRLPHLAARDGVDGRGGIVRDDIHHTVFHERLRRHIGRIVETQVPHGDQVFHRRPVDLVECRIVLQLLAHAIGQHV